MITVLGLLFGAVLLVGLVVLAMKSGLGGGRDGQSSKTVATRQQQTNNPRGDVRSGTGPN
jgi:hypothetical protein